MSAPNGSKGLDDDGPEEGEIEDDDDDDIVTSDNGNLMSRNFAGKVPEDLDVSPRTRLGFERDIREYETSRSRAVRPRLSSGDSESSQAMASSTRGNDSFIRRRERRSKPGLTHGKENRHIQRRKSPLFKSQYRLNSDLHRSERDHDSSPVHRYSSQSSLDSGKASPDYSRNRRGRQKHFLKSGRGKRSSSSPDIDHISSKRKPHHSVKCPLIKVLHSVAKETRLIAMETAESSSTGNSLKKRLFNMGVIPRNECVTASESNVSDLGDNVLSSNCDNLSKISTQTKDSPSLNAMSIQESQMEDISDEVLIIPSESNLPEVVTLTDSDDNNSIGSRSPPDRTCASCSCKVKQGSVSTTAKPLEKPVSLGDSVVVPLSTVSNIGSGDEDEDVGRLRLLALQSKKHEPTPPGDDDVLQLRLAALRTAIVKKFKGRKKGKPSCEAKPPSPLNSIHPLMSPAPNEDETLSPVDMDIAETDDEAIECEPHKSHIQDNFLQDLLPPPPPPDLPLDLYYHDQNADGAMTGLCVFPVSSTDELLPPPLPQFFQEILGSMSETSVPSSFSAPQSDFVNDMSHLNHSPDTPCALLFPVTQTEFANDVSHLDRSPSCELLSSDSNNRDVPVFSEIESDIGSVFLKMKSRLKKRARIPTKSQSRLPSKARPNLLEITINSKLEESDSVVGDSQHHELETSPDGMDIDSMIVLDEVYDGSPLHEVQNRSFEEEITSPDQVSRPDRPTVVDPNPAIQEKMKQEENSVSIPPERRASLEEEEQLLRQRLLLNLANKRTCSLENVSKELKTDCDKMKLDSRKPMNEVSPDVEKLRNPAVTEKICLNDSSASPTSWHKPNATVQKNLPVDNRFIINIGEDSDSSLDYSEAEALGNACLKNKEEWQRQCQLKDIDPNLFKIHVTQVPSSKNVCKAQANTKTCSPDPRPKVPEKMPQLGTLSDFETSVDRFLKGVRSSHDAKVSALSSSSSTPMAVRHLPASQQAEYRRLKQQIAELEKQKIILNHNGIPPQILGSTPKLNDKLHSLKNVNSKALTNPLSSAHPKRLASTLSNNLPVITKTVLPSSQLRSMTVLKPKSIIPKTKVTLKSPCEPNKVVSNQTLAKKDMPCSTASSRINGIIQNSLRISVPKSQLNNSDLRREVSVSSINPLSLTIRKPLAITENSNSMISTQVNTIGNTSSNQSSLKTLNTLEKKLVLERSSVLGDLSTLAKLLTQVDKSLEAQSHTATEVSNLLDQLCLAAGRWRAQNRTVTSLVAKVAQRQKILSLGHRRCLSALKSCTVFGSSLQGKLYRAPADKASFMHFQLKHVHEKTKALAKRRASEQERKNVLEKNAEKCLTMLFRDTKKITPTGNKSSGKLLIEEGQNILSHTSVCPPSSETSNKMESQKHCSEKKQSCVSSFSPKAAAQNISNPKSLLVSKLLAYRIAQSKVRSARATLQVSQRKGSLRGKKRRIRKKYSEMKHGKEELSDMDISLDGEDSEIKPVQDENMEVIDMALSPVISSNPDSPTTTSHIAPYCSPSYIKATTLLPSPIPCYEHSGCSEPQDTKNKSDVMQGNNERSETATKEPSVCSKRSSDPLKEIGDSVVDDNSVKSSKSVLKDYVSPLGGLKVSSHRDNLEGKAEDPYAILCPYDLNGKCQDSDCPFKHQH